MNNSDMPITPTIVDTQDSTSENSGGRYVTSNGLTKLEHFAGLAMQGMLASKYYSDFAGKYEDRATGIAINAVDHAKALLQQLEGGEDE